MNYTEGPWTVDEVKVCEPPGYAYRIRKNDEVEPPWPVALAITEADGQLIAAAPSMLARLENIIADCETWREDPGDMGEFISQIEAEARTAIMKTKGAHGDDTR